MGMRLRRRGTRRKRYAVARGWANAAPAHPQPEAP